MYPSLIRLCVVNASVAALALALRWPVAALFNLYWLELAPLCLVTIFQILRAPALGPLGKSRGYQTILFVAHFSTACVLYRAMLSPFVWRTAEMPPYYWAYVWIPLLALAAVHVVSYRTDFLARRAQALTPLRIQMLPYLRALPVHAALVVAWIAIAYDLLPFPLISFAAVKIVADVGAHALYRRRLMRDASLTDSAWDTDA